MPSCAVKSIVWMTEIGRGHTWDGEGLISFKLQDFIPDKI